jgi:hypothetical protein
MSELDKLLDNKAQRQKAFVAISKILETAYDESDWMAFGHENNIDEISGNTQLLMATRFGNSNHGMLILQTLDFLYEFHEDALTSLMTDSKLQAGLKRSYPDLHAAVHDHEPPHVEVVKIHPSKLEVVRQALKDAENLLKESGPASAFDRLHTALHGYLKEVCDNEGLTYPQPLPTVMQLYKIVRSSHPAFTVKGVHAEAIHRVALSMANALDSLNTLRNNASPAHPNDDLLDDVDGLLAFNATRTILNYVVGKVGD